MRAYILTDERISDLVNRAYEHGVNRGLMDLDSPELKEAGRKSFEAQKLAKEVQIPEEAIGICLQKKLVGTELFSYSVQTWDKEYKLNPLKVPEIVNINLGRRDP